MAKLEGIITAYGPALARVAASYEADPALREDLLQEIMLAVYKALPSLKDQKRLAPFVFRIAHNRSVTHVIQQSSRRKLIIPAENDEAATPEDSLLLSERSRRLASAVRRLPLPYRQVVTLVLEDLSYAEIAEALGLTPSNVGVRVNRAKAQLRALLDD